MLQASEELPAALDAVSFSLSTAAYRYTTTLYDLSDFDVYNMNSTRPYLHQLGRSRRYLQIEVPYFALPGLSIACATFQIAVHNANLQNNNVRLVPFRREQSGIVCYAKILFDASWLFRSMMDVIVLPILTLTLSQLALIDCAHSGSC